jgi:succinoglycan biosynthesis transport protein ExoP
MNYPQQSYQAPDLPPGMPVAAGQQPPDLLSMLWRWKWLPVLGGLLGLIIGVLVWVQMPPQFMALAKIQVTTPGSQGIPMVNLDLGEGNTSGRADDVVIMSSAVVLRDAIEIGRLNSNAKLSDKSPEMLIEWIRDKDRLTVRPGTKEAATNIVEIVFRCDDAELAAEVVNAIVLGYEKFISRQATLLSTEVLQKLAKFRDEYDTRSKKAQQEYLKIRRDYPLIGSGDDVRDPFTEALQRANTKLDEVRARLGKIQATIDTVEKERSNGASTDSLLLLVGRLIDDPTIIRDNPLNTAMTVENFLKADTASSNLRFTQLEPMIAKRESLESSLGPEHPQVRILQRSIERMEQSIKEMESMELEQREAKKKSISEIDLQPASAEERLAVLMTSLQQELMLMTREQQMLEDTARHNEAQSKEMLNAIAQLEVVRNEMNSITQSAEELRNALERLSFGTGYAGKVMKRLEIPQSGGRDGPYLWKYAALASFLGACAFTGLAYLLELADRSYRGPDEIARDLGVPILGHLQMSALTRKDRKDENLDLSLVAFHKPKSTASEAYRGVRTAIYFGNQAGTIKVIQVTSPVPGDGKSTVATNLAISIAQSGRRTLLLDCDMRRPRLAKLMGARDDIGLTNVLAGKLTLEEAIQATPSANLEILTCGRRPGNPAELLLSDDFVDVVNALRDKYDYIIMDTPPILAVSDPANASACADGVILTLRLRRNLRPLAIRAAQMLQSVNANLLGVAINGVTGRAGYGYGGYRYDGARATAGYTGYGGYGYGATYGYGDYYTSNSADAIAGRVVRTNGNGQAPANGPAAVKSESPRKGSDSTPS